LFLLVLLLSAILYFKYFSEIDEKSYNIDREIVFNEELKKNLIQNLKYEVNLGNKKKYLISSKFSEINNSNDTELINMENVDAKIIDKNETTLIIKSDYAIYNNINYNSYFKNNVIIEYFENKINADHGIANFDENFIKIYGNVKYEGSMGYLKTDIIKIDLLTRKISIDMNDAKDYLTIKTK